MIPLGHRSALAVLRALDPLKFLEETRADQAYQQHSSMASSFQCNT
jgi:hypothetical protein